jgi:hypothetical protein
MAKMGEKIEAKTDRGEVNEKVYRKAPTNLFLMRGFLRELFGYFS